MKRFFKENWLVIVTGIVVGAAALLLQALGNPKNMGFCIACFERDIVGAVGLHSAEVVQYVRPEIIGIVLGSCIMALIGIITAIQAMNQKLTESLHRVMDRLEQEVASRAETSDGLLAEDWSPGRP